MTLARTYSIGFFVGAALFPGCSTDEEPTPGGGFVDSGSPITTPGGTTAGANPGGGTTSGGTTSGTTPGGTTSGTAPGGTTSGTTPGSTAGGMAGGMEAGVPDGGAPEAGSDGGSTPSASGSCPGLPPSTSFDTKGPFGDTMTQTRISAGGEACTLFRPGASLGKDGFKHPLAVWGNGILTSPDMYTSTLSLIASHGFVVIACDSATPERPCLNACMDWLVKQNTESGSPLNGKLDTTKEVTIGYSWGGGAAIDTSTRPNVKATVSFHGMPPRNNPWGMMKAPLLLFTSMGDDFVSASGYVTPNYNSSKVPTFYATLNESVDHLYILDASGGAAKERGPAIAFMRYWACGDESAKKYFFGSDCTLCKSPWTSQKKPADTWK